MNENVTKTQEVRFPIETVREGNKITKTCVEDVYKMVNRVQNAMDKAYNSSIDIINSLNHEEYGEDTSIVFGKGISQPCMGDAFDEEIGNNIAFMKMKLNANIKKHNFLVKIYNKYSDLLDSLDKEIIDIEYYIERDLNGVRAHNPNYLPHLEDELDIA